MGKRAEPGGAPATVPTVDAIVKPTAEPSSADMNPTCRPRKTDPTNIAIGARVSVDSGGGIGNAVTVNRAIRADMTDDCATVVACFQLEELLPVFVFVANSFFSKNRDITWPWLLE
jgi:hypothetical protein